MKIMHITCTMLVLLVTSCTRSPEVSQILVTTYVERQEMHDSQVVSKTELAKTSFIALSARPISVTLPLGDAHVCSMSFLVRLQDPVVNISDVYLSFGGRKDRALFPEDESAAYLGPHQSCSGSRSNGHTGEPVELARWSYGRNTTNLNFKAFVTVELMNTAAIPKPDDGYEYEGKMYHFLQNVDPSNMRHGKN